MAAWGIWALGSDEENEEVQTDTGCQPQNTHQQFILKKNSVKFTLKQKARHIYSVNDGRAQSLWNHLFFHIEYEELSEVYLFALLSKPFYANNVRKT